MQFFLINLMNFCWKYVNRKNNYLQTFTFIFIFNLYSFVKIMIFNRDGFWVVFFFTEVKVIIITLCVEPTKEMSQC